MLCRKNAIFIFIRFYSRGQRRRCGIIMKISYLRWAIEKGQLDSRFASLYGADAVEWQRRRYIRALDRFAINFGDGREDRNVRVYSVSGRSEISGNHTDHNGGCIIGCAIDLDLIAVVSAREDGVIELRSEGFEPDIVRVGDGAAYPRFSSASLISGIAEQIAERGYTVGGFDAYTVSSVYKGSGLSSSAAFEDAVGLIINDMFCDGALSPLELAIISQRAERDYFGKACGLMDQAVCAVGGLVSLDFADESDPKVTQLCPNLDGLGLCMCITNTGGSHADLGDEYSAIPAEMRSVAEYFGQRVLRGLTAEQIISELPALRAEVGDRAVLRALHFVRENERVARVCRALAESDTDAFLGAIAESGRSSAELLQNVTVPGSSREQGVTLALALSGELLRGVRSAYRVHGGGFAGTVQAFMPPEAAESYCRGMDAVFGEGACRLTSVRGEGACRLV